MMRIGEEGEEERGVRKYSCMFGTKIIWKIERCMMSKGREVAKRMRRKARVEFGQEDLDLIDEYLRSYCFQGKLLRLARYEVTYFGKSGACEGDASEEALARARMFEVRHFITSLPNSDEKLLLYYHYIRGESVERCAELLGIARASAYRLKKRALNLAMEHWERIK